MRSNIANNMQHIFASLATHSQLVRKVINNFGEIHHYFNLSSQDEDILRSFFNMQGHKLLTTALLMEEKRWREVLQTLKVAYYLIQFRVLLTLQLVHLVVGWYCV